mgnify:CR=1 FL=1
MVLCNTRAKHTVADLQLIRADLKQKIGRLGC